MVCLHAPKSVIVEGLFVIGQVEASQRILLAIKDVRFAVAYPLRQPPTHIAFSVARSDKHTFGIEYSVLPLEPLCILSHLPVECGISFNICGSILLGQLLNSKRLRKRFLHLRKRFNSILFPPSLERCIGLKNS